MKDIFEENEQQAPSDILAFTEINKAALGQVSGAIVDRVSSGEEDALETYIKAKALDTVVSDIIKNIKVDALEEAEKYDKEEAMLLGCEFSVKNGATRYSFDHDETWSSIDKQIKELTAQRKAREKKMIDATNYAELIDDETGEVIPPAAIQSSGSSILAITIPKK